MALLKITLEYHLQKCYYNYIKGATDRRLDPYKLVNEKRSPYLVRILTAVVFACVFMFFIFFLAFQSLDFLHNLSNCNSGSKNCKNKSC